MLFILTGDIQIGKTRWLMQLLDKVAAAGVVPYGVTSPGIWKRHDVSDKEATFEKLGIETVFYPGGRTAPFAVRSDLAKAKGTYDAASQSAQAQLSWSIQDDAIANVNEHFSALCDRACDKSASAEKTLLVVDELGRLELLRNEGFTAALHLLELGETSAYDTALIVVRSGLVKYAQERFSDAWSDIAIVAPSDPTEEAIMMALGIKDAHPRI